MDASKLIKKLNRNEVLCKEGDLSRDLFYVSQGKLLICSRSGHMVTPLAYLTPGEYFGEMSFFDGLARSADVIALEETELLQIPLGELKSQFPKWLLIMAKSMTHKLRDLNDVISNKGIRKKNSATVQALSIDEQKFYYDLLSK